MAQSSRRYGAQLTLYNMVSFKNTRLGSKQVSEEHKQPLFKGSVDSLSLSPSLSLSLSLSLLTLVPALSLISKRTSPLNSQKLYIVTHSKKLVSPIIETLPYVSSPAKQYMHTECITKQKLNEPITFSDRSRL